MKVFCPKTLWLCPLLFLLGLSSSISTAESGMIMLKGVSGFEGGTYHAVMKSLNQIPGVKVTVRSTNGTLDNMNLLASGKAEIGIVQTDILLGSQFEGEARYDKLKILLPLYPEELHLVARTSIQSLRDLRKKTVSFGAPGSGTEGSADIVYSVIREDKSFANFWVNKKRYTTPEALTRLLRGEISAFALVSGAPVSLLRDLSPREARQIHLLSIPSSIRSVLTTDKYGYREATLDSGIYSWLKNPVQTVSVQSALVVRSDLDDNVVRELLRRIFKYRKVLAKAHPKWASLSYAKTARFMEDWAPDCHGAALVIIQNMRVDAQSH